MRITNKKDIEKYLQMAYRNKKQTDQLLKEAFKPKNKYNAVKVMIDGITFDSMWEGQRYQDLKLMQRQGLILDLELQPRFLLQSGFRTQSGQRIRPIYYVADFQYQERNHPDIVVVEDCKGKRTKDYILKKKIFLYKYPQFDFREIHDPANS